MKNYTAYLLFLLFLGLKLTNQITWSWWWIFAPLWVPAVIYLSIVILLKKII